MSSTSSGPGTLTVAVPHWAATVRLFDNSYAPVATLTPSPAESGTQYQVTMSLAPGVYSVRVTLGASEDDQWVSIRAGRETTIPVERWATLQLASAAPLEATGPPQPSSSASYAPAAQEWSKTLTWHAPQPGSSRLFIFLHTPNIATYPNFATGLTLRDAADRPLTQLSGEAVRSDPSGWTAFTTDLAPGFYILSRTGPGEMVYKQPVYLCDGWESHVFMAGGRGPSFRSLTMLMAPFGHGFRFDDDIAAASEAVMSGLRRETGMRTVMDSSHLQLLLRREHKNPWLAVLAAYGLMIADRGNERPGARPAPIQPDQALKQEIIAFLRQTIPSHPDVKAIGLEPDAPAAEPFDVPPLMRIGLERVRRHAAVFAGTIPAGSLTEKVVATEVTSSPWCVWSQPLARPRTRSFGREAVSLGDAPAQPDAPAPILRVPLSPSAPVFQAPAAANDPAGVAENLHRALYDLPVIKAAQAMLGLSAEATPETIVVDADAEAGRLLGQIELSALSAAIGVPLSRTRSVLDRLKAAGKDATGATAIGAPTGGATERAILDYALQQGARRVSPVDRAPDKQAGPDPTRARALTLEECVGALRDAAEQLLHLKPQADAPGMPAVPLDATEEARARALADRLRRIAKTLLEYADVIAITGASGELRYGNGAFALLMSFLDAEEPLRAAQSWSAWLSTMPLGHTPHQTSTLDTDDRRWTVRRTAVEPATGATPTAYVNIVGDERRRPLPEEALKQVTAAMSAVTLHASFIRHGSEKRRAASFERLERVTDGLDQVLSLTDERR